MDTTSEQTLARLIRETRVAALGTLHDGEPNLAMVAYAFADDFSAFYIHVSKLGKHTTDMESDPRVSLLIAETDDRRADPQTLARVSIRGRAEVLPRTDPVYAQVRKIYLIAFLRRSNCSVWEISIFGRSHQWEEDSWQDLDVHSILWWGFAKGFRSVKSLLRQAQTDVNSVWIADYLRQIRFL